MAEPSVTAAAAAATGLTFFGISTGLDPAVLMAGLAGAVWAQSYHPPMSFLQRVFLITIGAIVAGYLTPAVAAAATSWGSAQMLQYPIALLIGLTSHRVIGPAAMKFAAKKTGELDK